MSNNTINTLQFGIDCGRVIAHTKCPDGNDLREKTTKIIQVLDLDNAFLEDPAFLIGLGFGVADRHSVPLEDTKMSNTAPTSTLQLGIDMGRSCSHTNCPDSKDLREKTTKIVEVLGLDNALLEDSAFLIGLDYGVANRHKTPLDEATLDLIEGTGIQESWYTT